MLRHCDSGVHVGVSVSAGVDAEGIDAAHVVPHHLYLVVPTALRHQYVGMLGSHPEELCGVVGIPSSKHLEVREDCLTPVGHPALW